jgi:phosphoserine aminotransferase
MVHLYSHPSLIFEEQQPAPVAQHYNFSGGPGALPASVLAQASAAIQMVPEVGLSVLGISHRSDWFRSIVDQAEANFRQLLNLDDRYRVLFLQGGGSLQFSMIPMSFLRGQSRSAEYLHTGYWSGKSIPEARREGSVRVVWSGETEGFRRLPSPEEVDFSSDAAYVHYIANETVEGLQFHQLMGHADVPRICDMSSDFLSRPIDLNDFHLVYAHAQKNLGPSGVTVVVVREEFLDRAPTDLHAMLDYRSHIKAESIYNTPPVFAIYVTMLVSRWLLQDIGGLETMQSINEAKAATIYSTLDDSDGFYRGQAAIANRSWMNIAFTLPSRELEQKFLQEATAAGFYGLEGHRSLGGIRASLYNAVTLEAAVALSEFMLEFRDRCRR